MRNSSSVSFWQQTIAHIQHVCIWWISLKAGERGSQEGGLTPFHIEFKHLIASFCLPLPSFATTNNFKNVTGTQKYSPSVMQRCSQQTCPLDALNVEGLLKLFPVSLWKFCFIFKNKDSSLSKRSLVPATKDNITLFISLVMFMDVLPEILGLLLRYSHPPHFLTGLFANTPS